MYKYGESRIGARRVKCFYSVRFFMGCARLFSLRIRPAAFFAAVRLAEQGRRVPVETKTPSNGRTHDCRMRRSKTKNHRGTPDRKPSLFGESIKKDGGRPEPAKRQRGMLRAALSVCLFFSVPGAEQTHA